MKKINITIDKKTRDIEAYLLRGHHQAQIET